MQFPSDDSSSNYPRRTEVVQGTQNVIDTELRFFSKAQTKIDTYMNFTRPPLALGLDQIRKAFLQSRDRGIYLRYITEITKENLSYCKELMKIINELRHLDAIKGNFMISESEYVAPLILFEHGKIAAQAVYSNIREVVEQQQYIFDNIWNKAIPADQRIKEIEEGRLMHYETKLFKYEDEIISRIKDALETSNEILVCSQPVGLQLIYNNFFELNKKILDKHRKGQHKGIRWITTIDKDSKDLAGMFLNSGMCIRHIRTLLPMNFCVTDKDFLGSMETMKDGRMVQSLLTSNEPSYVNHFRSFFEELWKNGIDAKAKIVNIEADADLADIEVIQSSSRAEKLYLDIVGNAQKEIITMFPTANAFLRQNKIGAIEAAKAARLRNVKIRILMPRDKSTEQLVDSLIEKDRHPTDAYRDNNIDVRYIEQAILDTHATILVVDRKVSLVMEIRDDSKTTFDEAIGLSTYSNSKAGVLSYVSIFENLWLQTELYQQIKDSNTRLEVANQQLASANEQLKIHHTMQQEFINIAAHELRTPIQPILGLSQMLRLKIKDPEYADFLNIIVRNATRLQRLTEDILDVQKIESQTLKLNKARFNLSDSISNLVQDYKNQLEKEQKGTIRLLLELSILSPIFIEADRSRLTQVISNLINNAVKFTKDGTISVCAKSIQKSKEVIVIVKDTGEGIGSDILPRLFSKFASKSYHGTGLGLFISKGIIEAHGGKIWAENNSDGKGATFSFSLPAA
ncbi:MAG TPA: ATP-binding protein [Candidatus Nitrosopolaris sp.]|nr:ATP-binding protein [Candidatus Nitrosopolaris sp.]